MTDRFRRILPVFMDRAGINAEQLGAAVDRDRTTVLKWMRGAMVPTFDAVDDCDVVFARHGAPGLIDALRSTSAVRQGFNCAVQALAELRQPKLLRALCAVAPGLADQPDDFKRLLAEQGLADRCHIFSFAGGAWRIVEIGVAMTSKERIASDVLGLDVRDFCDAAYGRFMHDLNTAALARGTPAAEHVSGEVMDYSRAVVPVANRLIVALTYDVRQPPAYRLSSRKES